MLDSVILDQDNVWKIVRKIRKSYLFQLKDPECWMLLSDSFIKDNIDVIEEKLKLNIEINPNKNVSDETLAFAADIFTYLISCPSEDFYVLSVIKSESAKNILLALTSMMKTSQNAGKQSYTKIFTKAMEIFRLFIYRDIDVITKEKGFDDWRNNSDHYYKTLKVLGGSDLLEFLESL